VDCCITGLEPGRLFIGGLDAAFGRELTNPAVRSIRQAAWSPDGRRIAFTCVLYDQVRPGEVRTDICITDSNGSHFLRLTTDPASKSDPAWSPDGKRIAFTRGTGIVVLNLGDGVAARLTDGREPAWSPDGSTIVFTGEDGLFTIGADGSNQRRLTTGRHSSPAWRR
jgi:TolB protein